MSDLRRGHARRARRARGAGAKLGAPLIAVNDVLMHDPERRPLADVVACIREKTTLAAAGLLTQANAERHLKGPDEMARLFAEAPDAVEETMRFLDGIAFSLDELAYGYPEELREGYRDAAGGARSLRRGRRAGALSRRRPRPRARRARPRARADRPARLRALFPHRARHRPLRPLEGHPLPGARLGGQFDRLLLPRRSPRSTRRASTCCSSASSRPSAASRPTSTSISSTSGARR